LAGLAENGFLVAAPAGEYRLTADTRKKLRITIAHLNTQILGTLRVLSEADLTRLADLLQRVVNSAAASPEPPGTWCIRRNRSSDPGPDAPVLARVLQYLTDLQAFRDDAHLAAWRDDNVSGPAWETLTHLWRSEAHTADELAEKLAMRGRSAADYAPFLAELVTRGWIEANPGEPGAYRVTETGEALRQAAEDATNRYYAAPWATLSADELRAVDTLLAAVRAGAEELSAAPA
jgi:hypothetical protein